MNVQGPNNAFGSCKRLGGNSNQRIKLIFWEMIQGEERSSGENMPCWAACRTRRAPEVTVVKCVWKLEETERGGSAGAGPGTDT